MAFPLYYFDLPVVFAKLSQASTPTSYHLNFCHENRVKALGVVRLQLHIITEMELKSEYEVVVR